MVAYRITSPHSGADYGIWYGVHAEDVLRQLYGAANTDWPGLADAAEAFLTEAITEYEAEQGKACHYCGSQYVPCDCVIDC